MIHRNKVDVIVLSCLLIVLNSCHKDDSVLSAGGQRCDLTPPIIADFDFFPDVCSSHATIDFQNNSRNATSYDWDFGDGTSSDEFNPQKTYQQAGDYQVRLTARTSSKSEFATKTIIILANSGAAGPDAKFEVAINPNLKTEVTFANQSTNADSYVWNFGDGSPQYMTTSLELVHQYPGPGRYSVMLRASNGDGGDCFAVSIDINP